MPSFRRRAAQSEVVRCAARAAVEALEHRTLFTSLVNGLFTGTNSVYDGTSVFQYRQANGNTDIRISVTGNITAEFIGARAATGAELIQHPSGVVIDPTPLTGTQLVPDSTATSNIFLFSIYIVHADMNSAISIAQVANPTVAVPSPLQPMQPFTGGTTIRFNNATTGVNTATLTTTDGGVYIGALTATNLAAPGNNLPLVEGDDPNDQFLQSPAVTQFGLRPASAGQIFAGIQSAPKVSIGKIFIGGTITGKVDIAGQMDEFYAGNILTGDARGIASTDVPETDLQDNFHIGGSIHNLITANSFGTISLLTNSGTDPSSVTYKTGFQLDVGGRVGEIYANNSFLGSALINDDPTLKEPGGPQHEVEVRGVTQTGSVTYFDPTYFGYDISLGDANNDPRFFNDTFATAQFLGTSRSVDIGQRDSIQLLGTLGDFGFGTPADTVDYYAVDLLAGQIMDVKLTDQLKNVPFDEHPRIGIFDPDGRLIATDYSNLTTNGRQGETIQIVADRPGGYRIAVANYGDVNFNGTADPASATSPAETVTEFSGNPYELDITRTGDISLGGLITAGDIATMDVDSRGIEVVHGDVGEIESGTVAADLIFSFSNPWLLENGNLRAMEAVNMGINVATTGTTATYVVDSGPDFQVLRGSVGLLRTTGATATSAMILNDGVFDPVAGTPLFPTPNDDLSLTAGVLAVGGDIQLVDCAGGLEGDLLAKGSIGVIRALTVGGVISPAGGGGGGGEASPVWQVNVDGKGAPGTIDLVDATGTTTVPAINFPAITTGPNGNVRYVHVPTGQNIYGDSFFGGGAPQDTLYSPGQKVNLTDDSGTSVTLTPTPLNINPAPNANDTSAFIDPPELDVLTLPVRDKAGVVIVRVTVIPVDDTSDGVVSTGGGGLTVTSGGNGPNGSVEIGEIVRGTVTGVTAAGATAANTITFDPFNRDYTLTALAGAATDPRDVNFLFGGKSTVDVWNINDTFAGDTITSVINKTNGEIANFVPLSATGALGAAPPDVLDLEANTIGLAKSHTGTAVEGRIILDTTLPYVNQRNLVRISDAETIKARAGLGNLLLDNAGTIIANSDGVTHKGVFEGINAPVVVRQPGGGTSDLTGNLVNINIGQGVLPSGTGAVVRSGIFVDGILDKVAGKNADIRGIVDAAGLTTVATEQATDPVTGAALTNPDGSPLIVSTPTFDLGTISLNNGSIVDTAIMNVPVNQTPATFFAVRTVTTPVSTFNKPTFAIGAIKLNGNGGILGTLIETANLGPIDVQGGFGILLSAIETSGNSVAQSITTDGFGIRDTTINAPSLKNIVARGNGNATSVANYSARVRYSETTSIDPYSGLQLDAYNDLDKFLGTTKAKPVIKGVTNTGWIEDDIITGSRDLGNLQADTIMASSNTVTDPVTGKVTKVTSGDSRYPMRISFGNSIATIVVRRGTNGVGITTGTLKSLAVTNGMFSTTLHVAGQVKSISAGSVRATSSIQITGPDGTLGSLLVHGDYSASTSVSQDIASMQVGGNLGSKLVNVGDDLNLLSVQGSILTGSTVDVNDTLNNLFVGGDIKAGAIVEAHKINKQTIKGQISGDIIIT